MFYLFIFELLFFISLFLSSKERIYPVVMKVKENMFISFIICVFKTDIYFTRLEFYANCKSSAFCYSCILKINRKSFLLFLLSLNLLSLCVKSQWVVMLCWFLYSNIIMLLRCRRWPRRLAAGWLCWLVLVLQPRQPKKICINETSHRHNKTKQKIHIIEYKPISN